MNIAAELLNEVTAAGCQARVEGDTLKLKGSRPLSSELMEQLQAHKTELLALLSNPPVPSAAEDNLPPSEEARIRAWLAGIDETDPDMITDTLTRCRNEPDARSYFLGRADEVPPPLTADDLANITEAFEERAAIQEFDGELTRAEAERQARASVQIYRCRLIDDPARWEAVIACDLDEATRRAHFMFGPGRVLEVRRHRA